MTEDVSPLEAAFKRQAEMSSTDLPSDVLQIQNLASLSEKTETFGDNVEDEFKKMLEMDNVL